MLISRMTKSKAHDFAFARSRDGVRAGLLKWWQRAKCGLRDSMQNLNKFIKKIDKLAIYQQMWQEYAMIFKKISI